MNIEEIKNQAIKYFGTELAANVWMSKYALRKDGEIVENSPLETWSRMHSEIVRIDKIFKDDLLDHDAVLKMMNDMDIILGGSNLFGIGNNNTLTSLGNCFVIGNNTDSYGGICNTDQEQIQLMKRRGGVGHDLSHIRPAGTPVNNAAGSSTGVVPFMERYSNSTREVAQDGRRGALMLSIDIRHPEAEAFMMAKNDNKKITGANISLKLTDSFMRAVINDTDFIQSFPIGSSYPIVRQTIQARDLWKKIMIQTHKSAEPGVLFWDKIIRESPADCYGDYHTISTNPCAELPLCAYDSCRLLAINLYNMVDDPFTDHAKLNIYKLRDTAYYSQIIMDDIIELEKEKIDLILNKMRMSGESNEIKRVEILLWEKIRRKLLNGRRTGIGVMGLGDMFAALGIIYGSEEAIKLGNEVQKQITLSCYTASIELAECRGVFPDYNYELEKDHPFLKRVISELDPTIQKVYKESGRRNISNLTIAPTGTISILAGITSGIEPIFNVYYERRIKLPSKENSDYYDALGDYWRTYLVIHPKFKTWYAQYANYPERIDSYSKEDLDKLIQKSPYANSSTYEINPMDKIRMQGLMQRWIDHSISVTHNLPKETTVEQVSDIYLHAYMEGCKGVTIYRDGSREGVLTINNEKKDEFKYHDAPKRPTELPAELHHIKVKGEKYIAIVGFMDNKPYEIFCRRDDNTYEETKGKIRKVRKKHFDYITEHNGIQNIQEEDNPLYRVVAIYTSMLLRHGAKPEFIIHTIDKFDLDISSLVAAIQRILKKYIVDGTISHEKCPECGEKLVYTGGCNTCPSCGHSKCS